MTSAKSFLPGIGTQIMKFKDKSNNDLQSYKNIITDITLSNFHGDIDLQDFICLENVNINSYVFGSITLPGLFNLQLSIIYGTIDLHFLPNLQSLQLHACMLTDNAFQNLPPRLEKLSISLCNILKKNFKYLKKTSLLELTLSGNKYRVDFSNLPKTIITLRFFNSKIKGRDLFPLTDLINLKTLELSKNKNEDLIFIQTLNLEHLILHRYTLLNLNFLPKTLLSLTFKTCIINNYQGISNGLLELNIYNLNINKIQLISIFEKVKTLIQIKYSYCQNLDNNTQKMVDILPDNLYKIMKFYIDWQDIPTPDYI